MLKHLLTLATLASLSVFAATPAAPLDGTTWLKGKAPDFSKQVTVVEFWATWCPPCRKSIPHLTKLAQEFKGKVEFVGLSNEEDHDKVKKFVEGQGDKMDYNVGICSDDVHQKYMTGISGIPHAFIVDKKANIVWSGHPMSGMDQALKQILAGDFDPEKQAKITEAKKKWQEALRSRDLKKAKEATKDYFKVNPQDPQALQILCAIYKQERDIDGFRELFESLDLSQMDAGGCNSIAWILCTQENLAMRNPALALKAAKKAYRKEPDNPAILDTCARVSYVLGNIKEAIRWQTKAIEKAEGKQAEALQETLEYYQSLKSIK